jgi:formylglycine-generating enzyme required for sulfatase activity
MKAVSNSSIFAGKYSAMMKPSLLLLALFLSAHCFAQTRINIPTGCAFDTDVKNLNPYIFDADPQAQQIVAEICSALGIQQNFQLQSADVKNALASVRDGQRYILYNTDFLKEFQSDARSKWAAYGVLAHEIGHHLNFHDFNENNPERRKELELQADGFAGSALRLLGATKDEAKSAVSNLVNKIETATHPPPSARNLAVVNGWNERDQYLRKLGISGVNNPTGNNNTPVVRDRDGDGIPDGQDACPDVPGEALLKGCPDADSDGITDDDDKCPYKKGDARWQGCPDTDGDGLPDNTDKCPYVRGELADEGCPPADRDNDGIPDKTDRCPDQAGTIRFRGCADTDGDGVPDPDDKCPREKGDPLYDGCLAPAKPGTAAPASNTALDNLIKNRKSGLSMKAVEGGAFTMGSPGSETGRDADECQHQVTVAPFKIGFYEVTQADWRAVMGSDPEQLYFKGCDDCPVERVSWNDIQEFISKLNEKTSLRFRLPTEVEWEYAARGGKQSKGYLYAGGNSLNDVAWYGNNSASKTHPVGGKQANELGLFDMSGNVWEWCQDTYKPYPCDSNTKANDSVRVLRGGSWYYDSPYLPFGGAQQQCSFRS